MFSGATWRERAADGELADRLAALMPADLPAGAPARRLLGRFLAARGVGPDTLGGYLPTSGILRRPRRSAAPSRRRR